MSDIINDRMCGIRLQTYNNLVINIVSIYLPAQGSPESLPACIEDLCELIESRESGSMTIVCGDANCDMGHLGGKRGKSKPTIRGKKFYEFTISHNLVAVNLQPLAEGPVQTYVGPTGTTTIDYILTPQEMLPFINSCKVMDDECLNCSDHKSLIMSLAVGDLLPTTADVKTPRITRWNKISAEDIRKSYTNVVNKEMEDILTFVGMITKPTQIDEALSMIVNVLVRASKALPTSKFRPNLKPYWNAELDELKAAKIFKYKSWVADGRPRTIASESWAEHKTAKKEFASALKRLSKDYENQIMLEAISCNSTNRNIFWRHLKKCRKAPGSKVLAVKNRADKMVYEVSEILGVWCQHFSSLSTPKDDPTYDCKHYATVNAKVDELNNMQDTGIFLEQPFTTVEVQKCVNRLKANKACGFDSICAEHIKHGGVLLIITLTLIFNIISDMEYVL